MRFPSDIQPNTMDCGATCLRIISRHYGRELSVPYLRKITATSRAGASLTGLSNGAEQIGYRALAVKINFSQLRQDAPLPLIAHWNQNHFVVVYKVTKNKVFVSDPGNGLLTYSHAQFRQHWTGDPLKGPEGTGIALLLEPTITFREAAAQPESREPRKKLRLTSFLRHYVPPHRRLLAQVLLSLAAGSLLQLFVPFLTQNLVDSGIFRRDISFIWLILAAQLAITLGQMVLDLMRGWLLLHISSRINISLLSDFLVKLMRLPIRYFDTRLTGDLIQRIQDHSRIESFLTNTALSAVFSLISLLLYSVVLAWYSLSLFTVFLIGSAAYLAWILFFLRRRERLDYKRFQQASQTNSKVYELINGMQSIKLHNAEQQKRWSWERVQVGLFRISLKSLTLENVQSAGSRIINEVKNIFITVIAAGLVIDGQLTLGSMLAISYVVGQLNSPILQMVSVVKNWQDAVISLDRVGEIHGMEDETGGAEAEKSRLPLPDDHTITLDQVSFAYDELSTMVLNDISLEIPAGKVTAIVGSSGGGKSTLLKLLMRFYAPTRGRISIGGSELHCTDLAAWRERCGVVMQEGFLFNDTIGGNIALGDENPDLERLQEAARLANIQEFINDLPLGFQTKIGQEGLGISGGQKQRLLIARAVYQNPDILLFDEATSSLDANNERQIMENLETFYRGKTVVVIAHRLSTVRHADKIVVIEDGRIVEEGCHLGLTALKGHYYRLVRNQLQT